MNEIGFTEEMGYAAGVIAVTAIAVAMPRIVSCVSDYANRFWERVTLEGRATRFLMAGLVEALMSDMENFQGRTGRFELTPQAARFVPDPPRWPIIGDPIGRTQLDLKAAPAA